MVIEDPVRPFVSALNAAPGYAPSIVIPSWRALEPATSTPRPESHQPRWQRSAMRLDERCPKTRQTSRRGVSGVRFSLPSVRFRLVSSRPPPSLMSHVQTSRRPEPRMTRWRAVSSRPGPCLPGVHPAMFQFEVPVGRSSGLPRRSPGGLALPMGCLLFDVTSLVSGDWDNLRRRVRCRGGSRCPRREPG